MTIQKRINRIQKSLMAKAEEGQKKMIFGRPYTFSGGKWVQDESPTSATDGAPDTITPQSASDMSDDELRSALLQSNDLQEHVKEVKLPQSEEQLQQEVQNYVDHIINSRQYPWADRSAQSHLDSDGPAAQQPDIPDVVGPMAQFLEEQDQGVTPDLSEDELIDARQSLNDDLEDPDFAADFLIDEFGWDVDSVRDMLPEERKQAVLDDIDDETLAEYWRS